MLISVVKARAGDVASILRLDMQVSGSSTRAEFLAGSVGKGRVWVARDDSDAVGFVIVDRSFFGHHFIEFLIVHPGFRRKGIGSLLLNKVESLVQTEKLFTSTNQSNVPMQRLCESLGFIKSGYIENLDEDDPEIVYFKRIRTLEAQA